MSETRDGLRDAAANSLGESGAWTRRAGWFLAVILVVAVGLAVWLIFGRGHARSQGARGTTVVHVPPPSSDAQPAKVSADKGCAGVEPDSSPATKVPGDVSWNPVGLDSAPRSESVGPKKVSGHFRMCFAHTPTGAAFAASNITFAAIGYNDASVIQKQETDGPGKNENLASQQNQTGTNALLGYRVQSYDGENAVVDLAMTSGTYIAVLTQSMVWTNGDWYINGTPTGASIPQTVTKSIPKGFVMFPSNGKGVNG